MSTTHVVTGAAGFVGTALVAELLAQTDDDIVCIVRNNHHPAAERFHHAFAEAAAAYELGPGVVAAAAERCRVVAGDVTEEACGVREPLGGRVAQLWHCAASLRYESRYQAETHVSNVEGTRQALTLARRLGAETFNYISTAYVAGKRSGTVYERPLDDVESNNLYERTKLEAERLVLAASGLHQRIFRPSIIVGHSRTRAATNSFGLYAFLRNLVQFKGMMDRAQEGLLQRRPLRVRVDAEVGVNFIPVDCVVRQAVRIARSGAAGTIFHLTHPAPPGLQMVGRTIFAELGLPEAVLVRNKDDFSWIDQRFDQRLDFFGSYFVGAKHFDRRQSDAALGGQRGEEPTFDEDTIRAYCRWYLERLERKRSRLPVAR
jgi:nucleoside-diphosphate-sugar epimerase